MSRYAIQLEGRTILFSPDDSVPLTSRLQALVKLQVTDELTGKSPDGAIRIQVKERGFVPRVASEGVGGLVGIPRQVFPSLQTTGYVVHLTVSAAGYVSRDLEVKVPKDPGFPITFTPRQVTLALHREPMVITGRTVRLVSNAATPLGGAQISVTGIWRMPPPANVIVAPDPPNLVSLQPPLYADREALTQFLTHRDLPLVVGNDKSLMDDLPPGANPIRLSNRLGLAVGDIVLIDAEQPDLTEFIAIKNMPTTAPVDQPTFTTLNYPLMHGHRRGAIVRPVNPQPPGANRQFIVTAFSSDTCVFLDNLTGLATAREVQVLPGSDEYHKLMNFSVVSDADGYYRLPPLSRIAQLEIHAETTVGAQTLKATTVFRPDYHQRENRLDFLLTV